MLSRLKWSEYPCKTEYPLGTKGKSSGGIVDDERGGTRVAISDMITGERAVDWNASMANPTGSGMLSKNNVEACCRME